MLEWIGSSSPVSFRETSTCIFCVRIITVMKLEVDRHLAHCMFYFTVSNSLLSKQLRFAFSILIVFSFSFFEQTIFPHVKRCHSSRISDCDWTSLFRCWNCPLNWGINPHEERYIKLRALPFFIKRKKKKKYVFNTKSSVFNYFESFTISGCFPHIIVVIPSAWPPKLYNLFPFSDGLGFFAEESWMVTAIVSTFCIFNRGGTKTVRVANVYADLEFTVSICFSGRINRSSIFLKLVLLLLLDLSRIPGSCCGNYQATILLTQCKILLNFESSRKCRCSIFQSETQRLAFSHYNKTFFQIGIETKCKYVQPQKVGLLCRRDFGYGSFLWLDHGDCKMQCFRGSWTNRWFSLSN